PRRARRNTTRSCGDAQQDRHFSQFPPQMVHHGSGPTRRHRPDTSDAQTAISFARSTTMKNPIAAWVPRFVQLTNYGNALFSDSRNPLVVNRTLQVACMQNACGKITPLKTLGTLTKDPTLPLTHVACMQNACGKLLQ